MEALPEVAGIATQTSGGGGMFTSEGLDKTATMGNASNLGETVLKGAFQLGTAGINASASKYGAEQSRSAFNYQSDQNLAGVKYATDMSYKMWDRDYKIANSLGLYHPSQLSAVGPTDLTMLRFSRNGLARVQRTHGRSIYG